MTWEKVKIELLQNKVLFMHYMLEKGTLHDAWIQPDGTAHLYKYPSIILKDFQYRIYIPEQEYDKLTR